LDETSADALRTTGTVLVVDDEFKNRELLHDLLESEGHTVVEAEDGAQALAKVASEAPDAILLDVMMPELDGLEVCRRLKADSATAPIPVLLVTALTEREDRLSGIDAGANDFITKPIDPKEVALRTRNAVRAKKLYDQVRESYHRLKELEDLRDNLTHMIIHDLRSPLTGIMGFMQLLQLESGGTLGETGDEYLTKSLASCSILLEMISSLLDVSRLENGEMPLDRRPCDLRDVARDAVKDVGASAQSVNLIVELPPEEVVADCDPDVTKRVIVNLLSNAIRFTSEDKDVSLQVGLDGDCPIVSVIDSGSGMPPEYRDMIFEKFGQVRARDQNAKYSTGLGLTFCKLAVEAQGGTLGLESVEGQGSTFWFRLPAQA
jgi:signal transduction histidine kinase